ncbi:MAG: hypothetical protein WCI81_06465 [Chlorobiaceae bacterium]
MILKRIVFTIVLASGFCQPVLAVESASSNPTSGISPAVESGHPELKKLHFIDEDGDGINDAVQGRAGFSNTTRNFFDGSRYGDQSECRLFMDGHVGRGFGKGSGSPRGGPRR